MSSRTHRLLGLLVLLLSALGAPARAAGVPALSRSSWSLAGKTLLTRDEALTLAFPKCEVKRETAYLNEASQKAIAKLSKVEFKSSVVYPYRATKDGKWVGTAYFDTHRVRTLRETLMVVIKADGTVERVELLSFAEPREYIPRDKWYVQFRGHKLTEDLSLKRKIRGVGGATLTSLATTNSARRVLALHTELLRIEAEKRRAEEEAAKKKSKGKSNGESSGS